MGWKIPCGADLSPNRWGWGSGSPPSPPNVFLDLTFTSFIYLMLVWNLGYNIDSWVHIVDKNACLSQRLVKSRNRFCMHEFWLVVISPVSRTLRQVSLFPAMPTSGTPISSADQHHLFAAVSRTTLTCLVWISLRSSSLSLKNPYTNSYLTKISFRIRRVEPADIKIIWPCLCRQTSLAQRKITVDYRQEVIPQGKIFFLIIFLQITSSAPATFIETRIPMCI